jgi:hypothetical protein
VLPEVFEFDPLRQPAWQIHLRYQLVHASGPKANRGNAHSEGSAHPEGGDHSAAGGNSAVGASSEDRLPRVFSAWSLRVTCVCSPLRFEAMVRVMTFSF